MDLNTFNLYLFGGTGDLSNRKLIPAMFRQEALGNIDSNSEIIGIGSRDISVDEYVSMINLKHFSLLPYFKILDFVWFKNSSVKIASYKKVRS